MSLLFSANSHQVDHGSGSSLDNLVRETRLFMFSLQALTDFRIFCSKGTLNEDYNVLIRSTGEVGVFRQWSTGADWYETRNAHLQLNRIYCLAVQYDSTRATGTRVKFLLGTPGTPLVDLGVLATSDGSGTLFDFSAQPLVIAREPDYTGAAGSLRCTMHRFVEYDVWLPPHLIRAQFLSPRRPVAKGCVLLANYDRNVTGSQTDLSGSGNHGTITGATVDRTAPNITWLPETVNQRSAGRVPVTTVAITCASMSGAYGVAPITSSGRLDGPAAALGVGTFAATASGLILAPTAALASGVAGVKGSVALSAPASALGGGAAAATGSAAVIAPGSAAASCSAALTGSGALLAPSGGLSAGVAALLGSGALLSPSGGLSVGAAGVTGTGSLAAPGQGLATCTANFSTAQTNLTCVSVAGAHGAAAFSGSGAVAATSEALSVGAAALLGSAVLLVPGNSLSACVAAATGSATLTAAAIGLSIEEGTVTAPALGGSFVFDVVCKSRAAIFRPIGVVQ